MTSRRLIAALVLVSAAVTVLLNKVSEAIDLGGIVLGIAVAVGLVVLVLLERSRQIDGERSTDPSPITSYMRAPDHDFLRRRRLEVQIDEAWLRKGDGAVGSQIVALAGEPGVGKSELALTWARSAPAHGCNLVWWIDASSRPAALHDVASLIRRLDGAPQDEEEDVRAELVACLQAGPQPWLLVWDGCNDATDVRDLIPTPAGGLNLVTTCETDPGRRFDASVVEVPPFTRREAVTYLRSHADGSKEEAETIAEFLQRLPIALAQAATFLRNEGVDLGEYHRLLAAEPESALRHPSLRTDTPVQKRWDVTLGRISADCLALLGATLAFRSGTPIPLELLCGRGLDGPAVEAAAAEAQRYRLVSLARGRANTALIVHEVTALALRQSRLISPASANQVIPTMKALVDTLDPFDHDRWDLWASIDTQLTHLSTTADPTEDLLWCMDRVATYRQESGQLSRSIDLFRASIELYDQGTALEPDLRLRLLGDLSCAIWDSGRRAESLEMDQQLLDEWITLRGEDHPEALTVAHNLAATLATLGRGREALALEARVYRMRLEFLQNPDPDLLDSLAVIGLAYRKLGLVHLSLQVAWLVLEGRQAILHADHPRVMDAMNNVISSLRDCDRASEAISMARTLHQMRRSSLGNAHPDTYLAEAALGASMIEAGSTRAGRRRLASALRGLDSFADDHEQVQAYREVLMRSAGR